MSEPDFDDLETDPGHIAVAPPQAPPVAVAETPPERVIDLDQELKHLDPRAVTLWRIGGAISTIIWSVIISLATVPAIYVLDGHWMAVVGGAITLVLFNAVVRIAVVPPIRYRLWRYQLRADQLFLQRGWLVVRRTLVPLVRIQNVDTVQGPIARRFGLWSVVVFTAANAQSIPALSKEQADHLRETIAELARRARDQD